jgi:hypothetical protein
VLWAVGQDALLEVGAALESISSQEAWGVLGAEADWLQGVVYGDAEALSVRVAVALLFGHLVWFHGLIERGCLVVLWKVVKLDLSRFQAAERFRSSFTG